MAEGNGLLNRRTGKRPYRGFESRPLRSPDDSQCQAESKSAKNKVVTTNKAEGESTPNEPNTVPTADSPNTMKVTSSDKLDNKQNNKPTKMDSDLTVVVEAWPEPSQSNPFGHCGDCQGLE